MQIPTQTINGVEVPALSFEDGTAAALEWLTSDEGKAAFNGNTALHALVTGAVIVAVTVAKAPLPIKHTILTIAMGAMAMVVGNRHAEENSKPE